MLIQIETMKSYLGLPDTDDPVQDPILERSMVIAQNLVSGYVGMDIEAGDDARTYTAFDLSGVSVIRLPAYPLLRIMSVYLDDVLLAETEYCGDKRLGMIILNSPRSYVKKVVIKYVSGYEDEDTVPIDLKEAIVNIAIGVYSKNGNMSTTSTAGALKSLTMFDAMSMSFDVGASSADAGTPQGMLAQWAFVLDKYKVDSYIMGN